MQPVPRPDPDEIRDNATFAALMWALARPGRLQTLPQPGMEVIALALCDRENRVHADDPALAAVLQGAGAALVPPELADHVFAAVAPRLAVLRAGSALYPDEGATLVLPARLDEGPALRLTGPGVDGAQVVQVRGPDPRILGRTGGDLPRAAAASRFS